MPISPEELQQTNARMHMMSPTELREFAERLIAEMPAEAQAVFRQHQEMAAHAPARARLTELSRAALQSMSSEDVDLALYDYVSLRIGNQWDQCAALQELPRGLQICYLSFLVEAEVMNGGFHQFFWNPSADLAPMIAPALRALPADAAADLFELAQQIALKEAAMRATYQADESLAAFSASCEETALGELDKPFCALAEHFPALRASLIQSNLHELCAD